MKLITVISILSIISNSIYGQTSYNFDHLKEGYEKLDIKYVSGNVLYMINAEMKRADPLRYKRFISDRRDAIYSKYNFGDTDRQKAYLDNYNSELKRIRNTILANDVLLQVKPEVVQQYAIPALNRYGSNYASPFLSGIIQPAMKGKMAEFTIQKIWESANEVLNRQKDNLDSLTTLLIQYWKNAGVTLDQMQQNTGAVKDSIIQLIKNLPAPDSIQTFLLQSAAPLAKRVKQQLNEQWNNTIIDINNQQVEVHGKLMNAYQDYVLAVKSETEEKFSVIGKSFEVLVKNEETVYNTLDKIQKDWMADTAKISSLEEQIRKGGNNARA